jgi:hypothetical protein
MFFQISPLTLYLAPKDFSKKTKRRHKQFREEKRSQQEPTQIILPWWSSSVMQGA